MKTNLFNCVKWIWRFSVIKLLCLTRFSQVFLCVTKRKRIFFCFVNIDQTTFRRSKNPILIPHWIIHKFILFPLSRSVNFILFIGIFSCVRCFCLHDTSRRFNIFFLGKKRYWTPNRGRDCYNFCVYSKKIMTQVSIFPIGIELEESIHRNDDI